MFQAPSGLRIIFAKEMLRGSQNAADLLHELGACIRNMHRPKSSVEDCLKKNSRAAEDIKELISTHSYLLAAPENWAALETIVHERVGGTQLASEQETILTLDKLVNPNRFQAGQAAPDQDRCSEPGSFVHDDLKKSSQVPKPVHILLSEDHEKDGPQPLSGNEPKTQPLFCGKKENRWSAPEPKTASCSALANLQFGSRGVEDIAGAASLISFASLLIETLARLDHVVAAVQTLSESGRFTACTCVGPCASAKKSKRSRHLPISFIQGAAD